MDDLWGAEGQRYSLGRLTIGATDFSVSVYRCAQTLCFCSCFRFGNHRSWPGRTCSYNDHPDDFEQGNFSIKHDEEKIIPLALRAQQAIAPNFTTPNQYH